MRKELLLVMALVLLVACGNATDDAAEQYDDDAAQETASQAPEETARQSVDEENTSARPSTVRRRADISLAISGSQHHDGSYRANGTSRMCGFMDDMLGQPTNNVTVQFPYDEQPIITDLTFNGENFEGGSTSRFHLTAHLVREGRQPPGWVLRAGQPGSSDTGVATVTESGDSTRLTVTGERSGGGRVEMTVVCTPPAQ